MAASTSARPLGIPGPLLPALVAAMRERLALIYCVVGLRLAASHPRLARWLGWTDETWQPDIIA